MSRVFGFAVVVLGLSAGTAAAGAIQWEYSSQLTRVGNAYGMLPGMVADDLIGTGGSIHEDDFSRLVAADPGVAWGWRTVQVGAIVPAGLRLDPLTGAPNTFRLDLTIRDRASGQTGTLTFNGHAWEDIQFGGWNESLMLSRHVHTILSTTGEQDLTLGGNTYHVSVWALDHQSGNSFLEADVTVGATNATPEPGTLALAGLGIGLVGVRLRRRPAM
jgi:hypothetical protein